MTDVEGQLEEILTFIHKNQFKAAIVMLRPLVEKGVPRAIGLMGFLFQVGFGVQRDGQKAVSYLERAARLGDGSAAHNLGTIYFSGMPGVPVDLKKSKFYYRRAKRMGFQVAPEEFYK